VVTFKATVQSGLQTVCRLVSKVQDSFVDIGTGVICVADARRSINRLDIRIDCLEHLN
jgi:prefoldin subunit 5